MNYFIGCRMNGNVDERMVDPSMVNNVLKQIDLFFGFIEQCTREKVNSIEKIELLKRIETNECIFTFYFNKNKIWTLSIPNDACDNITKQLILSDKETENPEDLMKLSETVEMLWFRTEE